MIVLPRLARFFNQPGIAALLGLILVAVGVIGLITDDIRPLWAIVIIVVGAINLLRTFGQRERTG